jgi:hypothetical protein
MAELILCLIVVIFICWLFGFQIPAWGIRWMLGCGIIFVVIYMAVRLAIITSSGG